MNWGYVSQKTAFFIATAVKTSDLKQEACVPAETRIEHPQN
jgi:hypothetical protein